MTKKLIMILGLVLSSMLMKAQAFFVPFPKAGDKYWQKQVPVAMHNDSPCSWACTMPPMNTTLAVWEC
jgi:Na+/glutamate symporter